MTIRILEKFTGYPDGEKRLFQPGEELGDLSPAYAELLVSKGHAERMADPKPAAKAKPSARKDADGHEAE